MRRSVRTSLVDLVPHGYGLADADWQRRHRLLVFVLALHVPLLAVFGLVLGRPPDAVLLAVGVPAACLLAGWLLRRHRRVASVSVTGGLVYSSAALVGLTGGTIEAHFHFFIIIGFIALYQDWVPFLFNVVFTVLSHGVGSVWQQTLMFNHPAGQGNPWLWSSIHGVAVLVACVGMALFWRVTEDSQQEKDALQQQLAESEINRRQFASDMLVNLARRNQSMLYRQLEIINQLEESEQDPDALAELFKLDHLATRVQRNAESLLVLSGEQPARVWGNPIPLREVVRAAIAETEDLDRVSVLIDERPAVAGHAVTDVTHLLAELTENAVRFSPPDSLVRIRTRPDRQDPGGQLLVIEDWGVGMRPDDLAAANKILADAPDVDMAVAQRLGFHVVARLGARHRIRVELSPTPGSGITALVAMPSGLFERDADPVVTAAARAPVAVGAAGTGCSGGGDAHRDRFEADDTVPGWRVPPEILTPDRLVPAQRSGSPSGGNTAANAGAANAGAAHAGAAAEGAANAGRAEGGAPQEILRRRVPQSHLVPELRAPVASGPARPALPPAHASGAADALTRFHSGRRAALAEHGDADRGVSAGEPGTGGGAWFEPAVPVTPDSAPEAEAGWR